MLSSDSRLRAAARVPGPDAEGAPSVESSTVLASATLVEVHPPRLGQADVLVRGTQIVQVGGTMPEDAPRVDLTGCILTPAFAIAHTHLYMSLTCGMPPPPAPPRTLADSLQWVWWALDRALDDELVETSALVGAAMAAKAGVACVVDLHSSRAPSPARSTASLPRSTRSACEECSPTRRAIATGAGGATAGSARTGASSRRCSEARPSTARTSARMR